MAVLSLALLAFMYHRAGGLGPMLSVPSKFTTLHSFLPVFLPALTGMVGYWATLSLNIPDFTRYARSQDSQILGQSFGLPVAMTLYASLGIVCTSASAAIFGHPIWSPVELLGLFHQPLVAVLALIGLLVATLNVNIGANVVGPSNDFANLAPRLISFRTGGLITGALGICIMPWRLLSSSSNFTGWLVGYSGLLGPVAGIMVADYFLIRHRTLILPDLYRRHGVYEYTRGINPRAVIALLAGIALALIGRFVPSLSFLFSGAWFTGFFTSAAIYLLLMRHSKAGHNHAHLPC
jgi:NCS1 family nucleobase:cation symporter-1